MKAFEIQTFQDGKWRIDSIFDDRDLALFEARRVDEGSRYSGVRVIEEVYDEVSDLTTTRTIFRGGRAARMEKLRKAEAAKKAPLPRSGTGVGKEPLRRGRAKPAKSSSSFLVPLLMLSLIEVRED